MEADKKRKTEVVPEKEKEDIVTWIIISHCKEPTTLVLEVEGVESTHEVVQGLPHYVYCPRKSDVKVIALNMGADNKRKIIGEYDGEKQNVTLVRRGMDDSDPIKKKVVALSKEWNVGLVTVYYDQSSIAFNFPHIIMQ